MKRSAQPRSNPEGRKLAASIKDAKRRGYTNQMIGDSLGINPRTVRRIAAGETSGTKSYRRIMRVPDKKRADENTFNAEFVRGHDAAGNELIASVNVVIPNIGGRTPTPLDMFRTNLNAVIDAERERLNRKYQDAADDGEGLDDEDREFAICARRYCHHDEDAHADGDGHCMICRCPFFMERTFRAPRLRTLATHRKKAIQLQTGL